MGFRHETCVRISRASRFGNRVVNMIAWKGVQRFNVTSLTRPLQQGMEADHFRRAFPRHAEVQAKFWWNGAYMASLQPDPAFTINLLAQRAG